MVTKFITFTIFVTSISNALAASNLRDLQWGIKNLGEPQRIAIDHFTSGYTKGVIGEDIHLSSFNGSKRKVIVAVLDTGIDYAHPNLKNKLASQGLNTINKNADANDTHGHGTHTSGIIAADQYGVADHAYILPIKVVQTGPNAPIRPQDLSGGAGTALTENVAKGLVYAIENGAEVINLSLAWPSSIHSKSVDAAILLAEKKNVIIVSSAGNDSTLANVYPCIYENVICVGAHGSDGSFAHYSNYGPMVDILAPGTAILSTWPMQKAPSTFAGQIGYEFRNGTSMAAPFVAGAAAELLSRGFNARETKARILLGARTTSRTTLFTSGLVNTYSTNRNSVNKFSNFGNLDIDASVNKKNKPLITLVQKAPYQLEYNEKQILKLEWKNDWDDANHVKIVSLGQSFYFNKIKASEHVSTPLIISQDIKTESLIYIPAQIYINEVLDRTVMFAVQFKNVLSQRKFPKNSHVRTIKNLDKYTSVRSVVTDSHDRSDLLFINKTVENKTTTLELTLAQNEIAINKQTVNGLSDDQLLNIYRLPDQSYAIIFTETPKDSNRPNFIIKYFDTNFNFSREIKVGTETTVLSENFKWTKLNNTYTPIWISIGYTPPLDLAKFDPWNPKAKDLKIPRIYYVDGQNLRTVKLKKEQLPLQIMPSGEVLVSEGFSYTVNYSLLKIENGLIVKQNSLNLTDYRMLIGAEAGSRLNTIKGDQSDVLIISGASSPGNLRVSGLSSEQQKTIFDHTLYRSSPLESLIQVIGKFSDLNRNYYFVQTHYDLKLFTSDSNQTSSTTLNRYSYIPSMIFNRNFYPVLIRDQNQNGHPGIYIPATLANNYVSEIIVVDEKNNLTRPASLRFQLQDQNCTELANLVEATISEPAKQVFVCGNTVIEVPLTIQSL